jgi:hypothetical protein
VEVEPGDFFQAVDYGLQVEQIHTARTAPAALARTESNFATTRATTRAS